VRRAGEPGQDGRARHPRARSGLRRGAQRDPGRRAGGIVIAPRWRKVLRDVLARPGRSALAVLALSAGIFEIGALLYKYAVLQPVLTTMYEKTRPASATLSVNGLSDALVDSIRRIP